MNYIELKFVFLVVINFTVIIYNTYSLGTIKNQLREIETNLNITMSYLANKIKKQDLNKLRGGN